MKNSLIKRFLLLLAVLVAFSCLTAMTVASFGCGADEEEPSGDTNGEQNGEQSGDQNGEQSGDTNGEQSGDTNGEQNGEQESGKELLPDLDCGHTLNKYGYCGTCQLEMSNVTVAIGKDITLEYHIAVSDPEVIEGKTLQVVINDGDHVEVITDLVPEGDGFVFKYHGIAPHQMSHKVDAALLVVDGGQLTVIDDILKYTVKQNIQELLTLHKDDAEITQILSDILRYGAASQVYMNYEVDDLATDGIEGLVPPRMEAPEKDDMAIVPVEGVESNTYFSGATVLFDSTTKLKITVATDDISKVTVRINGGDALPADAFIAGEEGKYYFYTESIGMAHFGDVYTFTVYDNGVEVETLTYSVNSYAYSKKDSDNAKLKELVLALYRAGLSASEWVATH